MTSSVRPWFWIVIVIVLGIGYGLGFAYGVNIYPLIDAAPKGVMATAHLRALNTGKDDLIKQQLERDIDASLINLSRLKDKWWFPFYRYSAGEEILDSYMHVIANYRKLRPPGADQEVRSAEEQVRIESILHEYAE